MYIYELIALKKEHVDILKWSSKFLSLKDKFIIVDDIKKYKENYKRHIEILNLYSQIDSREYIRMLTYYSISTLEEQIKNRLEIVKYEFQEFFYISMINIKLIGIKLIYGKKK